MNSFKQYDSFGYILCKNKLLTQEIEFIGKILPAGLAAKSLQ